MVKFLIVICCFSFLIYPQESDRELVEDFDELSELLEEADHPSEEVETPNQAVLDDLEAIKSDVKEAQKELPAKEKTEKKKIVNTDRPNQPIKISEFDVGKEEKELLELAKNIGHKIPPDEWDEIARTKPSYDL